MIGTIRRHSTVLWWIIVAAVIVSFVAFFGSNQPNLRSVVDSLGGGDRGKIYGRSIKSDELRTAARRVGIMMGSRQMPQEIQNQQIYEQILLNDKFREFGIVVSDAQLAEFIKQYFRDPATGQLIFERELEASKAQGITEAEYLEFVRSQIANRHLRDIVEIPAQLVTPRESESEVRRANEQALVTAVFFSASNHLASVQLTPDALGRFFTNNIAGYRTADRLVASYVKFPSSNHLAAAESLVAKLPDLTLRLETAYNSRGATSFRDAQGNPLAKEAALARLREEELRRTAVAMAGELANEFYNDVAKIEPVRAENIETVAAARKIKIEITQPFSGTERPLGLESLRNIGQTLAALDPSVPFTEPLPALDGVYIVAIRQRIPSATPTLDAVRARVTEDFRRMTSTESARTAGQAFHNLATNALASGKSFAALVAEQKLAAVDLPPFTIEMSMLPGLPPQADLSSLKDAAFSMKAGEVSNLISGRDGGYVVYLRERKPASEEVVKAALPKATTELRQREERAGFSEWFGNEWIASGLQAQLAPKPKIGALGTGTPEPMP